MPAQPEIGQSFQQEFSGSAQDHFVVLQIGIPVEVPYRSFPEALFTAEWTPLEPDVLWRRSYVKRVGEVTEFDVAGSSEGFKLISVSAR